MTRWMVGVWFRESRILLYRFCIYGKHRLHTVVKFVISCSLAIMRTMTYLFAAEERDLCGRAGGSGRVTARPNKVEEWTLS